MLSSTTLAMLELFIIVLSFTLIGFWFILSFRIDFSFLSVIGVDTNGYLSSINLYLIFEPSWLIGYSAFLIFTSFFWTTELRVLCKLVLWFLLGVGMFTLEVVVKYLPRLWLTSFLLLVLTLLSTSIIRGSSIGKLPTYSVCLDCYVWLVFSFLDAALIEMLVDCKWLPLDEGSLFHFKLVFLCFYSYFTFISV